MVGRENPAADRRRRGLPRRGARILLAVDDARRPPMYESPCHRRLPPHDDAARVFRCARHIGHPGIYKGTHTRAHTRVAGAGRSSVGFRARRRLPSGRATAVIRDDAPVVVRETRRRGVTSREREHVHMYDTYEGARARALANATDDPNVDTYRVALTADRSRTRVHERRLPRTTTSPTNHARIRPSCTLPFCLPDPLAAPHANLPLRRARPFSPFFVAAFPSFCSFLASSSARCTHTYHKKLELFKKPKDGSISRFSAGNIKT